MTLERFCRIVEAYGADPARWPEAERAAALALLARSDEARAVQAKARPLDAALDRFTIEAARPALADAIIARLPTATPIQTPIQASLWRRLRESVVPPMPLPGWASAAGLAAALVLGLAVGWNEPLFAEDGQTILDLTDSGAVISLLEGLGE